VSKVGPTEVPPSVKVENEERSFQSWAVVPFMPQDSATRPSG